TGPARSSWHAQRRSEAGTTVADVKSRPHRAPLQYNSRNFVLRNLPVPVRGISFANTNFSGSHHFGNRVARWARKDSGVAAAPALSTTTASGRSCHFGSAIAITADSCTDGCDIRAFSRSTELIHSPPDLIKSFVRSVIRM